MSEAHPSPTEKTYPLRAASRITGLSAELLRAWERRYGVVVPMRTPGGTRRYRASDLEKLRLVKAAVDAGHRIGRVAEMGEDELREAALPESALPKNMTHIEEILSAVNRLDAVETQQLLSFQLSALGPVRFARQIARPLVYELGERWRRGEVSIAAEHMATAVLRTMFGAALQPTAAHALGPRILFATPPGQRHELGLQMAALTAMGAGAQAIFLGADLPADELARAVERTRAVGVGLSIVPGDIAEIEQQLRELDELVPGSVHVWVGGQGIAHATVPDRFERITSLDEFERRIALVGYDAPIAASRA
jgi:DNA-binding transcriptional MerR regulator/methylmalonyl-CoA mutase cobalamin-binding subunit